MRASVWWRVAVGVCLGAVACGERQQEVGSGGPAMQQAVEDTDALLRSLAPSSLKRVPVPRPRELQRYVRDEAAAVALGKALFWDVQAGSDGQVACASCHFHAGADVRTEGTRNPGPNGALEGKAPLALRDFPFHVLEDFSSSKARVLSDSDDVVGSRGVARRRFLGITPGVAVEQGGAASGPVFHAGTGDPRQVTPRHSPSVINAVFNFRNFWDGRASHFFNGVSAGGAGDADARIWVEDGAGLTREQMLLDNASLASQAVDPAISPVEMSFEGRPFPLLGRKLLSLRPLGAQHVHPQDSVLGPLAQPADTGLSVTYDALIQRAFQPRLWSSAARTPEGYSQVEANFALFWGLALQLYQATLVSDDAPYDRFMDGAGDALTEPQKEGMLIFFTHGRCSRCHVGSEFTAASVGNVLGEGKLLSRMEVSEGFALYDTGFYNVGLRPPEEDAGLGKRDAFGTPMSYAERYSSRAPDPRVDVCRLQSPACPLPGLLEAQSPPGEPPEPDAGPRPPLLPSAADPKGAQRAPPPGETRPTREGRPAFERTAVVGAFKAPGLRNVELTGPYMHNGAMATLLEVMRFYHRGADFPEENRTQLGPHMLRISLENEDERLALVEFLRALTDERVRFQRAPFDHPELPLPGGERVEAVGAQGSATPLRSFEERLGP